MAKDPQEQPEKPDSSKPQKPDKASAISHAAGAGSTPKPIESRRGQYLIATKPVAGLQPFALDVLEQSLRSSPEVEVLDTITPHGVMGLFSTGTPGAQKVIVANMQPHSALSLQQNAGPQLIVERNHPLTFAVPGPTAGLMVRDPGVLVPQDTGFSATFTVLGNGAPLAGADVYLFGSLWPVQGVTDAHGQVTLTLFGESPNTVQALYVKPKADYWSLYLQQPAIIPNDNNLVSLTSLSQTNPNFPGQQVLGWGQKAMRLDQVPDSYKGRGVRIGVIDSGAAATTHRDLQQQIRSGFDVVAKDTVGWSNDTVSHGSHCAGVIAGRADNNVGIRGFAPEAEVIVCKIFPGGMFSHLISALDFCIEQQVDVINLSLGSDETSQILEQRLQKAKELGIACIVAAGNTGGPVQYPAASPNVLAVAAMGKRGEFPADSYHGTMEFTGPGVRATDEGYFSAKFTCFGTQIGVCAPGVAIISSVPPDAYAAWDGTSMAAPHVTGLAALVLAHHPDFQAGFRTRNAQRVDRLFQILKQSCRTIELGDRNRTGAGLPDCMAALNLQQTQPAQPVMQPDLLRQLLAALQAGGLAGGFAPASTPADLKSAMQQAGLLANGGATSPQMNPASVQPLGTPTPQPPANATELLRAAMQSAGLLGTGASTEPQSGQAGAAPATQMSNLGDAMKRAGLL